VVRLRRKEGRFTGNFSTEDRTPEQSLVLLAGSGATSTEEKTLFFGIGSRAVDQIEIEVKWPGSGSEWFDGFCDNGIVTLSEGSGFGLVEPSSSPLVIPSASQSATPSVELSESPSAGPVISSIWDTLGQTMGFSVCGMESPSAAASVSQTDSPSAAPSAFQTAALSLEPSVAQSTAPVVESSETTAPVVEPAGSSEEVLNIEGGIPVDATEQPCPSVSGFGALVVWHVAFLLDAVRLFI